MGTRQPYFRGCLLGLAVGDAMGYTVDDRNLEEIRRDYGPNGLLGYDLVNGYADVTSHTQLAAFTTNGLLLGLTHGQLRGRMAPYVRYIRLSDREWAQSQRSYGPQGGRIFCWVYGAKELRGRRCMDQRMLDTLSRDLPSSLEEPSNRFETPGSIVSAVPVGLFYQPHRTTREENNRLGAEAVALTHGNPTAFLSGAVLAHLLSRIVWDGETDLKTLIPEALDALDRQFGREYPQTREVAACLRKSAALSEDETLTQAEAMEVLGCDTALQVLAGALYACLTCRGDFDAAMITAVNHSGRSAAVGAVAGAILGAIAGESALPDFYLESLEPVEALRILADDLFRGCPMDKNSRLYDDDWARKYIHYGA